MTFSFTVTPFTNDGQVTPFTLNASSSFKAGRSVVLFLSMWSGGLNTVTAAGKAAAKAVSNAAAGTDTCEIWYANNVEGNRADVIIDGIIPAFGYYWIGAILEVNTGYAVSKLIVDQTAIGNNNNNAPTVVSPATQFANEIVLAGFSNGTNSDGEAVPSAGFTNAYNAAGSEGGAGDKKATTTLGIQTALWATSGGGAIDWAAVMATFRAVQLNNGFFFGL